MDRAEGLEGPSLGASAEGIEKIVSTVHSSYW